MSEHEGSPENSRSSSKKMFSGSRYETYTLHEVLEHFLRTLGEASQYRSDREIANGYAMLCVMPLPEIYACDALYPLVVYFHQGGHLFKPGPDLLQKHAKYLVEQARPFAPIVHRVDPGVANFIPVSCCCPPSVCEIGLPQESKTKQMLYWFKVMNEGQYGNGNFTEMQDCSQRTTCVKCCQKFVKHFRSI